MVCNNILIKSTAAHCVDYTIMDRSLDEIISQGPVSIPQYLHDLANANDSRNRVVIMAAVNNAAETQAMLLVMA